jgi:hypothetical protein
LDISAQEAVRVATANSLARLGTQEANTILEEANNTEKTSEFLLQKFAVAIKRGAHALEKNQRFAAKIKN